MKKIIDFLNLTRIKAYQNRREAVLLGLVLLAAFLIRVYKIADYLTFLGDEGRDMITIKRIIVDHQLTFLGPTASVGGFYLGPAYYYLAAPFLWLFRLDPTGPAVMVVLFALGTIFLIYQICKEFFGFYPAIFTSLLYAFSPLIIFYSRSSWNPNILPFFSIFMIYCLVKLVQRTNLFWAFLAGLSLGVAIQLHYLAFILWPIGIVSLFLIRSKKIVPAIPLFLAGATTTFLPFLLFEIKNQFPNFRTIGEFVTRGFSKGSPANLGPRSFDLFFVFRDMGKRLFEVVFFLKGLVWGNILFLISTFSFLASVFIVFKKTIDFYPLLVVLIYLVGGILGIGFYRGSIFDYYFAFIFPLAALLFASFIYFLFRFNLPIKFLAVSIFLALLSWELAHLSLWQEPNRQLLQTKEIASLIIQKAEGKPYNFALIAQNNSDHAYRYFLEIWSKRPLQLEEQVTDQLMIVCEEKVCQPLGHPLWEIAGFGRAEIAGEWEGKAGIRIFKLTHYPGVPSPAGKPVIKGV